MSILSSIGHRFLIHMTSKTVTDLHEVQGEKRQKKVSNVLMTLLDTVKKF